MSRSNIQLLHRFSSYTAPASIAILTVPVAISAADIIIKIICFVFGWPGPQDFWTYWRTAWSTVYIPADQCLGSKIQFSPLLRDFSSWGRPRHVAIPAYFLSLFLALGSLLPGGTKKILKIIIIIMTLIHRVPKKTKQICFCQNFVKFPQISIIFGRKMGNNPNICEVHSFSTSPNLCHHLTVLNANVPNCYITLNAVICNKLLTT